MAEPVIVREWLEKADEDFNFAAANLREENGFYAQLCFHFQQAAEKYLKAYIIGKELPFDRVHDLPTELPHPYTSDDEHELLTTFRNIKQSQNKQIVISVSRMAAQTGAVRQ